MPAKKSKTEKSKIKAVKVAKSDKKLKEKVDALTKEALTLKTTPKKTGSLNAEVFSLTGKVVKTMALPKEVFGEKINEALMTQAVLIHLANQRAGSASTKTRGQVIGSTRKIYRQKGTGRARHGGITAPIFVGGGVAHGPHPHSFSKKLSQKMRTKALFSALSARQKEGAIKVVSELGSAPAKTKDMAKGLTLLNVFGKSVLLVIASDKSMENAKKSGRNIEGVSILPVNQLNTYAVLKNKSILFAEEAIGQTVSHFLNRAKAGQEGEQK